MRWVGVVALLASPVAATPPTQVESSVHSVVVHPTGAVVTRRASVELEAGRSTLRIGPLPDHAIAGTVRAKARSEVGATVLGLLVDTVVEAPTPSAEDRSVETELRRLEDVELALTDRLEALDRESQRLVAIQLSEALRADGRPLSLVPSEWRRNHRRLKEHVEGLALERVDLEWQRRAIVEEQGRALERYDATRSLRVTRSHFAEVDLALEEAGAVELSLRYLVSEAGWRPLYRVEVDRDRAEVVIHQFARVSQESGENWEAASLAFSTAVPSVAAGPPAFDSWRIREGAPELKRAEGGGFASQFGIQWGAGYVMSPETGNPQGLRFPEEITLGAFPTSSEGAPVSIQVTHAPADGVLEKLAAVGKRKLVLDSSVSRRRVSLDLTEVPWDLALEAVLRQTDLEKQEEGAFLRIVPRAVLEREGSGSIQERLAAASEGLAQSGTEARGFDHLFRVEGRMSVPSRPQVRTVELGRAVLPAVIRHEAVPVVDGNAYLIAEVREARDAPQLAGPAEIFLEGSYLGRSSLRWTAPRAPLRISLGVDPSVLVERGVERRRQDVGLVGNDVLDEERIRIVLGNHSGRAATVRVFDRIPITATSQIEVSFERVSGPGDPGRFEEVRGLGAMYWERKLAPEESAVIEYRVGLRHARDVEVRLEERPRLRAAGTEESW